MIPELEIPYRLGGVLQLVEVARKIVARADIREDTKKMLTGLFAQMEKVVNQGHFHSREEFVSIDQRFDIILELLTLHKNSMQEGDADKIAEAVTRYRGPLPF